MFAPILITAFNRPKYLQDLLESLVHFPSRIYVALDAAKLGDTKNAVLVSKSIEIINSYGDRITDFRISTENQGCFLGVSNAISWAFSKESELIILEEDIQVGEAFLIFVSEMLERFREEPSIGSIAGMTFVPVTHLSNASSSIRFSAYTSSWGWGTWKDRWQDYERDLKKFPYTNFSHPTNFWTSAKRYYWSRTFSTVAKGNTDSWAYRWLYSNWENNRLTVIPKENLALNIGFGSDATHTRDLVVPWWLPKEISKTFRTNSVPTSISRDLLADNWMERHHFRTEPLQQFRHKLIARFPRVGTFYRNFKTICRK